MNFVCLANFHTLAVFPFEGLGELLVSSIVVVTTESITDIFCIGKVPVGPFGTGYVAIGSIAILIELTI